MNFLFFFLAAYAAVLLFRLIMTQQELNFNNVGRGVAKLTNPLLAFKGKTKAQTDKLIPIVIFGLTFFFGLLMTMALGSFAYMPDTFQRMLSFLTIFFIVCVLLGSIVKPGAGSFPLYFYRLGAIFVNPVRKVLPIKGNIIIVPAIIFIMILFVVLHSLLLFAYTAFLGQTADIISIAWTSVVEFVKNIAAIVRYLSFVIIARALLSWFSPDPRNMLVQLVFYITEPVISPLRRIIPPIGMFDLSALAAIFLLFMLQQVIQTFIIYLSRMF